MAIPSAHLHVYRCRNCHTVAVAPFRAAPHDPLICNLCHTYMKYLYRFLITTDGHRKLAAAGVVFNPGVSLEWKDIEL